MTSSKGNTQEYEPTWDSLKNYRVPEWFKDAKLGVFVHWGVYAVPAFDNEWYPRNMYRKESAVFAHHRETWGPQSEFGYKDFIPLFKAEKWDPEAWAELFERSGAKYVVPVAEHHDGFAMYESDYTRWNSAKMGPCRDVVAELEKAVRNRGLKFGVSSHRAFNWRFFTYSDEFDTSNEEYSALYSPPHREDEPADARFLEDWFARTKEIIDRFRPDVLFFDFGWHEDKFAPYRPKVTAYYYNRAVDWGKEVVLTYKEKFPVGTAVLDIERGKLDDIREDYWQTDTSVSYKSWCYIEDDEFRTVTSLVHDLVDIVSKNGNLLLNVGPRADGTIPDEATELLVGLGDWLKVNGEAIYGTRHWQTFGEGTTPVAAGHMTERDSVAFTAEDIRFTTRPGALYAVCLGWPGEEANIKSLGSGSPLRADMIAEVRMLGSRGALAWSQDENGLKVKTPAEKPCEHAYAFKIALKNAS